MLNFFKIIEILICLQTFFISTMIPVFIALPLKNNSGLAFEIPITWQIPSVILMSLFFKEKIIFCSFAIYLFIGLFVFPIFHQGGSLGYLTTPNFGYLIGLFPLIKIISNLAKKSQIKINEFLKSGTLAIFTMHFTGIIYNFVQIIFYKKINLFFYNIGNYSLGKIGYHLLMLIPIAIIIKPTNHLRSNQ